MDNRELAQILTQKADATARKDFRPLRQWFWARGAVFGVVLFVIVAAFGAAAISAVHGSAVRDDAINTHPTPAMVTSTATAETVLEATGYIVALREATVSSKITGRIRDVLISEGMHLNAGDVVARIDARDAEAAVRGAKASLAGAIATAARARAAREHMRERMSRLQALPNGYISTQALVDAKSDCDLATFDASVAELKIGEAQAALAAAQSDLSDTVIRAPFAGVVTNKSAQPGEMVSPTTAGGGFTRTGIGTVVDMDSLVADVDVNENYIGRVSVGEPVRLSVDAYPNLRLAGHVATITPTVDKAKATITVRITIDKLDPRILPQMAVRARFLTQTTNG